MIKDKYKGQRLFILGSGPSLKGFDFNRLDNDLTIALNHTVRYYNKAKMLLFMDRKFVMEWKSGIDSFQGDVFFRSVCDYQGPNKNTYCFGINKHGPQEQIENGLFMGESAGLAALNLGLIMGCSPIYLLGFDIDGGYFFVDEFKEKGRQYEEHKKERMVKLFKRFDKYKNRIFTCSHGPLKEIFNYVNVETIV